MSKISALPELTTPANDDEIEIVDKSDTSQAASGTNKRIQKSNLLAGATPAAHATTHQNSGADEVSVAGLSGVLADPQIADKVVETSGPTTLDIGDIVDGEFLKRVGSEIVSDAAPGGAGYAGVTTGGTGSLDMAQGTKTADEPFVDGSVTWNSGAVTFNAINLAVTDSNSNAVSNLVNLKVAGASVFRVQKQGRVYAAGGNGGAPHYSFEGDTDTGIWSGTNNKLSFSTGGLERVSFSESATEIACDYTNGIKLQQSTAPFRWSAGTRLLQTASGLRIDGNSNGSGDNIVLGQEDTSSVRLKRNGTRVEAKLGDDSAYTQLTCEKLGVNNSAAATTPGSVTKKIEIFDAAGNSLGFIAVYDSIT